MIEVGINKPLKSIKKAIALAKVNDTVLVYKEIYKEGNIIINKKITFLGRGYPTLDGQKKYEVLSIKTVVIVKGFKVISSGTELLKILVA